MARGGSRPGAGPPKGAVNRSSLAIIEAANSGGEMPIEYMLRVMRDEDAPDARRDLMARLAGAYLHSRIAALPVADEEDNPEARSEMEAAEVHVPTNEPGGARE
ncbi:MAG TPA: hypothetical protein VEU06_00665 [Micropepsaceae bacterium]|nr:hypothetical protein [Micropepsaceae bacterium]